MDGGSSSMIMMTETGWPTPTGSGETVMPAKVGRFQRPFAPLEGVEVYGHGVPNVALAVGKIASAEDIVSTRIKATEAIVLFIENIFFSLFLSFILFFSFCLFVGVSPTNAIYGGAGAYKFLDIFDFQCAEQLLCCLHTLSSFDLGHVFSEHPFYA
jgi:hypothetical protein